MERHFLLGVTQGCPIRMDLSLSVKVTSFSRLGLHSSLLYWFGHRVLCGHTYVLFFRNVDVSLYNYTVSNLKISPGMMKLCAAILYVSLMLTFVNKMVPLLQRPIAVAASLAICVRKMY
jgi:hypothetical protein